MDTRPRRPGTEDERQETSRFNGNESKRRPLPFLLASGLVPLACAALLWAACNGTGPEDIPPTGLCVDDTDCEEHHVCEQGVCEYYEPPACELNGCPDHTFCDADGLCKASGDKQCSSDEQCGDGFLCASGVGRCQEACILHSDCGPGLTCNNAIGACVECTFDPDCTGAYFPYCLSEEGRCVGCLLAGQCDNGFFCDVAEESATRYSCQEGCIDGNDCLPGTRCERPGTEPGRCVECSPSTAVQDCQEGARQRCHPDLRMCVSCFMHDHCNVGNMLYCHQDDFVCVQCLEHSHCPKGTVCLSTTSSCVPGCTSDDRCPPLGEADLIHCDSQRGTYGECVECMSDDHCDLGYRCDDGACVEGCSGDANCPEHKPRCDIPADRCVECLGNDDCASTNRNCDLVEKACTCRRDGDACSASAECGNPPVWPDPYWDGTCLTTIWCVDQVKCTDLSTTPYQDIVPAPRCGLACSISDRVDTCPSGYCCRKVRNAEGVEGRKCVSNAQCTTTCYN